MFLLRLIGLLVWVALSWQVGQNPPADLGVLGKMIAISFFLAAPVLYFFPMYEAYINKQPDFFSIFALNLLLGWTLVGWVAALVWALKTHPAIEKDAISQATSSAHSKLTKQPGNGIVSQAIAPTATPFPEPASLRQIMECPFCAEEILAKAKKCKHCGSDVVPQV